MHFRLQPSLRAKTLAIIVPALVVLVVGLYTVSRMVLTSGFSHVESDFAADNLSRASNALSNEIDNLQHSAAQVASEDQMFEWVRQKDAKRIAAQFAPGAFEQLRVNFVVVFNARGQEIFAEGFKLAAMEPGPVPADLVGYLRPWSRLLASGDPSRDAGGIAMLSSGPALIGSSAIAPTGSHRVRGGTLVFGRFLDADETVRLGQMTYMPVDIERFDARSMRPDFRRAASALSAQSPVFIHPDSVESLGAYQVLRDIYGNPAAILRILLPRNIYRQGQTSLLQVLLLLLAAGFAFGAVTLFLLERFVISRVAGLSENITRIGASGDLGARLRVSGNDELAHLESTINSMLEDLEAVQHSRREERTRLAVMVEKVPAVLWTTSADLVITSATGAGLIPLGLRERQPVGLPLLEFFDTDDRDSPPIAAHRATIAGESIACEISWKERRFESHLQPLRDVDGVIQGVIGVALDITERERLTDQLRQSQKMQAIGELAGGVAHDFNNLLMVVKGHSQLLLDRLPDSSPLRPGAQQIEKAADRAASLTRQLLAFSRKQVLHPRVLDMNEVVNGMIRMFSRVIGANIDMVFLPAANLSRVKADPGQVEQVLLNLVVNARDAMPTGGRLTIETSNVELDRSYAATHTSVEPGHYVMLSVTDTGCGMSAETQSRIFEPFFTTKGPGKGTGLGLATVYGVVKQSGGYIYVYSEIDRGTTFKIYLPQVIAELDKLAGEAVTPGQARGSETILFVEDEQSVRELVRQYLGSIGYSVLEASDGVEALKVAAGHSEPIHLLITDVVMPHLSGPDLATQLGASRPGLKVLFISGYTDDTVFRHGVLEGGVAFLQKPFNLKALAGKIREMMDGQPVGAMTGVESEKV
jgi:signal transduction histidine kinase/CheY-like chemotaxis protein